jgi:hypothetical protein
VENEQTSRLAKIWVGEDGIVRIIWVPGAEVTLEDAREIMEAYHKLRRGRRLPLFIDTRTMKSFARGARHLFAGEEAQGCASAAAIIVDSPVTKVLANFYLGLSKPRLPSRLFSSEDEALVWLKGYLE